MDNHDIENSGRSFLKQSKSVISRHWVIITLLIVALLIRVVFFTEIIKSPLSKQYLWDYSDMNFFHSWAQEIVDGDWLINKPLHPYHNWHERKANEYFISIEARDPMRVDLNEKRQLWNRWYGEKRYHQEPLYPYLIAFFYQFFGVWVGWIFLFQLFIGIINILLIYVITLRFFGRREATIAGTLAVLCAPLLFFEMVLLRSTLISFSGLFLVWLIVRKQNSESSISWMKLGLFLGLSILLKSTFLYFIVCLMGWLIFRHRHSMKRALTFASALIAGIVISLTPLMARNVYVGTSPLGLSSITAVTLLSANARDSKPNGFYISDYIVPIMDRTNGAVLATIFETLKTQSFINYIKLEWQKFRLMWHWFEIPNNTNFYYYRLHSQVLHFLPITFLILSPFCIVGIGLAIYQRRRCFPLYLLLSMYVISILIVFMAARFRAPLIAASLPFAALTVVSIVDGLQKQIFGKTLLICILLILVSFWTMSPLPKEVSLIRTTDVSSSYTYYYQPLLLAAQAEGNLSEYLSIFEALLRSEPQSIRRLSFASPPQNQSDRDTALLFSQFLKMYSIGLKAAARNEEMSSAVRRAKELEALSSM